jgi:hypothetical protein
MSKNNKTTESNLLMLIDSLAQLQGRKVRENPEFKDGNTVIRWVISEPIVKKLTIESVLNDANCLNSFDRACLIKSLMESLSDEERRHLSTILPGRNN